MIMTYEAMTLWFHDDLIIMRRDGDVVIEFLGSGTNSISLLIFLLLLLLRLKVLKTHFNKALDEIVLLQLRASPVVWDHTCHPTHVKAPRLNPSQ